MPFLNSKGSVLSQYISRQEARVSLKNYQQNDFFLDISMVPWCIVNCFDDIDDSLYAFNPLFNEVLNKHAPIKKVKIRGGPSPYTTDRRDQRAHEI